MFPNSSKDRRTLKRMSSFSILLIQFHILCIAVLRAYVLTIVTDAYLEDDLGSTWTATLLF